MANFIVRDIEEIDILRKYYRRGFSARYLGWDDAFDKQFDSHSNWFCLYESRNKIGSIGRITFRPPGKLLPIEMGNPDVITDDFGAICEINNFNYRSENSAIKLIKDMAFHLDELSVNTCYCLVDTKIRKAFELNTRLFNFAPVGKELSFEDVKYRQSENTVTWEVLIQEKAARDNMKKSIS
jgi:hypothetical protein